MGFPLSFFFIIKLNNMVFFVQILFQDKYNVGVFMVNIEFMWLGTKARLSPVSKPRHINSIFTNICKARLDRVDI